MSEWDAASFRAQLDTMFQVDSGSGPVTLRLAGVTDDRARGGVRQFSILFHGPADPTLPQGTYTFRHEALGELALFIVPIIGSNHERIVYEACFSQLVR